MKPQGLRLLIIALLTLTGVFHLLVALLNGAPGLAIPLTVFGVIYTALGFYVRKDVHKKSKTKGRIAIILAMAACAVGISLGGWNYMQNGGSSALPLMFLFDIAIIGAGAMWLMKVHAK